MVVFLLENLMVSSSPAKFSHTSRMPNNWLELLLLSKTNTWKSSYMYWRSEMERRKRVFSSFCYPHYNAKTVINKCLTSSQVWRLLPPWSSVLKFLCSIPQLSSSGLLVFLVPTLHTINNSHQIFTWSRSYMIPLNPNYNDIPHLYPLFPLCKMFLIRAPCSENCGDIN